MYLQFVCLVVQSHSMLMWCCEVNVSVSDSVLLVHSGFILMCCSEVYLVSISDNALLVQSRFMLMEGMLIFFSSLAIVSFLKFRNLNHRYGQNQTHLLPDFPRLYYLALITELSANAYS